VTQVAATGTPLYRRRRGIQVLSSGAGSFSATSPAGLSFWAKADAGTSTTTDGVAISQWNDQTAGAHHLTQGNATNQPLYKAAIQNGLPGVLFDGANDSIDNTTLTVSQPDTLFVVGKSLVTTASHNAIDGITTRQVVEIGPTSKWGMYAGTAEVETATAADLLAHTFSVVFNGASTTMRLDGTALTVGSNPGAGALTGLRVGSFNNSLGNWNGYVFEVLLYTGALSTTDQQTVESYLRSKWATP
jgi:hypothetical protein